MLKARAVQVSASIGAAIVIGPSEGAVGGASRAMSRGMCRCGAVAGSATLSPYDFLYSQGYSIRLHLLVLTSTTFSCYTRQRLVPTLLTFRPPAFLTYTFCQYVHQYACSNSMHPYVSPWWLCYSICSVKCDGAHRAVCVRMGFGPCA